MVHARVSEKYIHFALMYSTDHIFTALPIKHLVNQYGEPTTPHILETGTKLSVSNPHIFFSCVVQKATAHIDTKALNMRNQSQTFFVVSLLESYNIKKGTLSAYLVHGK